MQLNPQHFTVANLLNGRMFRIPEYQRAYSWREKQRADLFKDIEEASRSKREHFMATLVAVGVDTRRIDADEFRTVELVDGQQRVTTLVILLKSIEKALDEELSSERRLKREIGELLVKGDDHSLVLLQTNHDSSDIFGSYIREGVITDPVATTTVADRNLVDAMRQCEAFVECWTSTKGSRVDLVATIRNQLTVIYHELADQATVYRVFEVLNSRGLDVKWIDKLKSQLMGLIFEHVENDTRKDAVHEMQVIWQGIYRALGSDTRVGDEALRFAGTWAISGESPNRIASEEAATASLVSAAGVELKSIAAQGRRLAAVVDTNLKLVQNVRFKAVTRIAHARFVAVAIMMRGFSKAEEALLLGKWERVTFRIFELGGADTRHKVGEYVRLGHHIESGALDSTGIVKRLDEIGADYSITKVLKDIDWSDCYHNWAEQLRYIFYRYDEHLSHEAGQRINTSQWNRIWADDPSRSIEHILPQSSGVSYVHQLGNLMMLPPGVNSSLSDDSPVAKSETYKSCGLVSAIRVGETIDETTKWNSKAVSQRTKEIERFIRSEWAS